MLTRPVAEFLLFTVMISRLYFVKNEDSKRLKGGKNRNNTVKGSKINSNTVKGSKVDYLDCAAIPKELKADAKFVNKVNSHFNVHMSACDQFLLFFHVYLPCLKTISCWSKKREYTRLYKRGKTKVTKNLNVRNLFK